MRSEARGRAGERQAGATADAAEEPEREELKGQRETSCDTNITLHEVRTESGW